MRIPDIHPRVILSSRRAVALHANVTVSRSAAFTLLDVVIHNDGRRPLAIQRVRLFDQDLRAATVNVFRQGFFMPGDPCAVHLLRAGKCAPKIHYTRPDWLDEQDLLSHTMTEFALPGTRMKTLTGFTTHKRFESFLVFRSLPRTIRLAAWCNLGGIALAPGESLRLEQMMFVQHSDSNVCLDRYAEYNARINSARVPKKTVTGWIDWQYYREEKTAADILANARALAELKRRGFPLEYLIIDGGFCDYASEWLGRCEKFPSGMAAFARRIRRLGFKFGIWFAPYITNVKTRLVREHPEWLVRDRKTGRPLRWEWSNVGRCNVIDYSIPAALDWLRRIVRVMVRDWKIGYLKLDGPALRHYRGGRFHDPQVTAVEQIRRSLEVIREECGDEVLVEGEGLYGVSIGMVDLQRTTQDNHPYWYYPESGAPAVKEHMQGDLQSGFMHGRFWHNHRENVIVRDSPSPFHYRKFDSPEKKDVILPENELRLQLTATCLGGGAMLLSDMMPEILRNPEKVRLIAQFLPHYESAASFPLDAFRPDGAQPAFFCLPIHRSFEDWFALGVFNWDDSYRNFRVPLSFAKGQEWHAYEFWSQRYFGRAAKHLDVNDVPPHACRLIALRRVQERPQLLGTDLHLLQGAVDIRDVTWQGRVLRVDIAHFCQDDRTLAFHCPPGFRLARVRTNAKDYLIDARSLPLVKIHFDGRRRTNFELQWQSR